MPGPPRGGSRELRFGRQSVALRAVGEDGDAGENGEGDRPSAAARADAGTAQATGTTAAGTRGTGGSTGKARTAATAAAKSQRAAARSTAASTAPVSAGGAQRRRGAGTHGGVFAALAGRRPQPGTDRRPLPHRAENQRGAVANLEGPWFDHPRVSFGAGEAMCTVGIGREAAVVNRGRLTLARYRPVWEGHSCCRRFTSQRVFLN